MTVLCTSGVMAPPPGISTQVVLPLATVVSTVNAVSTSTPFVVTPVPVMEQPGVQAQEFFDTLAVRVPGVASVIRTVVLVSLAHAAVGSSK